MVLSISCSRYHISIFLPTYKELMEVLKAILFLTLFGTQGAHPAKVNFYRIGS